MKKTNLLFAAVLLTALCPISHGQTWNGSSVSTATSGGLIDMTIPGDPTCTWRALQGGTANGGLNLLCNTNYTDGALIQFWGKDMLTGCAGENRAGSVYYDAFANQLAGPIGHRFMTYVDPSSPREGLSPGFHTYFEIGNDGRSIIGKDVDYSNIAYGDNLTVRDNLGMFPSKGSASINGNAPNGALSLNATTNDWSGPVISLFGPGSIRPGCIDFFSNGSVATNDYGQMFYNYDAAGPGFTANMGIMRDGRVVIGQDLIWSPTPSTAVPGTANDYRLYVEKGILTEKLKVANSGDATNWSDFVFNKDYKLMSLDKVESFVKENKHLPEIPSASEVAKDGIDVAGMDAKLLQKIEELTLYVIQQDKKIKEQDEKIESLSRQIKN